jgi:pimeloyl-ACP methyl ester carboxylesterase
MLMADQSTPFNEGSEPSSPSAFSQEDLDRKQEYRYASPPLQDRSADEQQPLEALSSTVPPSSPPPRPGSRSRWTALILVALVLLVLLVLLAGSLTAYLGFFRPGVTPQATTAPAQSTAAPASTQAFKQAACPFAPGSGIVQGRDLICGFLTVPEDRTRPQGPRIHLAVAIFKAALPEVSSIPLLYLSGGPGGATLSELGPYITLANRSTITLGRTFILLDQRGTGYSTPSLYCSEVDSYNRATQDENLSRSAANAGYVQAMQTCHRRLVAEGINLSAYTTIADAEDVHDLIHALGYRQVDLYGVSYGTRLALTVMRLFPQDLHSVILDSTLPLQSNLFQDFPAAMQHAFDTLFNGCQADAACREHYPQLADTFYALVDRLNVHPVTFRDVQYGPVLLNGDGLAEWVFLSLYVTSFIPDLPDAIEQIDHGQYGLISRTYGFLVLRNDISYGMYYSVSCGEDMRYTSLTALTKAVAVMRPQLQPMMLAGLQADYAICQDWNVPAVPPAQKQPFRSALPTLILSGEYDPITPTSNARLVMQTLSHSYLFVFPGTGHGVFLTDPCPDLIMSEFLSHPEQRPQGTCISLMGEPAFL